MTLFELPLLNYLLNALWQVPLIFFVAAVVAHLTRSAGPQTQHRVWIVALGLEVVLPACAFAPAIRAFLLSLFHSRSVQGITQVTILNATVTHSRSHFTATLAMAALIAYVATLVFFIARLLIRLHNTRALRHSAQSVTLTAEPLAIARRCARMFSVHDAQFALSEQVTGPSTIGIRRRIILLPPTLLSSLTSEDLAAVFAHEFAHMRRRDFAKNLLYELIALPIAFHPFLWLTRHRLTESREMVCDELAAAATHGPSRYAHSLLRLAASFSRSTSATAHAIGILDANVLERRVMTLNRKSTLAATSRCASIVAAVILGAATCASAMSLRLEVPAYAISAPASAASTQQSNGPVRIAAGIVAGQIISKVNPVYPEEAKAQGIQGSVVLHAIIGRDGTIQELTVVSGPPELTASAMDAVKQWTYQPYLLNGDPVEVDTTITVNYSLEGKTAPPPPPPPPDNPHAAAYEINGPDGRVYQVGGSIRPPVATYAPDPQYTLAARKAKLSGNVVVALVVGPDGQPYNVHVARGLGNVLDQKAVEAVQQYKFNPATKDGEPVAVALNVQVNFQIF